jgi:5-methylcytosine-specific restriction endonuclease McrA
MKRRPRPGWTELRLKVLRRDMYCCRFCGERAKDVHHIVKRSQGSRERVDRTSNLVSLCRVHHDRTDWPYRFGRLVIEGNADAKGLSMQIVTKDNKWA